MALASAAAAFAAVALAGSSLARAPGAVSPCRASALRATYSLVYGSNGLGHVEYLLTVTNHSRRACTVAAPLSVTLLGAHGQGLPTHATYERTGRYSVRLAAGQWAQAASRLSPDIAGPGEPGRGDCEPVAHALRIGVDGATVGAPMDPTPVCEHGAISFDALSAVGRTPACSPAKLTATFRNDTPDSGPLREYALVLHTRSACHLDTVLGLRLEAAGGRPLQTRVRAGISSPVVIRPRAPLTAAAEVAVSGGFCTAPAASVAITPIAGGHSLSAPVQPPVSACRHGLLELSTLFRNG